MKPHTRSPIIDAIRALTLCRTWSTLFVGVVAITGLVWSCVDLGRSLKGLKGELHEQYIEQTQQQLDRDLTSLEAHLKKAIYNLELLSIADIFDQLTLAPFDESEGDLNRLLDESSNAYLFSALISGDIKESYYLPGESVLTKNCREIIYQGLLEQKPLNGRAHLYLINSGRMGCHKEPHSLILMAKAFPETHAYQGSLMVMALSIERLLPVGVGVENTQTFLEALNMNDRALYIGEGWAEDSSLSSPYKGATSLASSHLFTGKTLAIPGVAADLPIVAFTPFDHESYQELYASGRTEVLEAFALELLLIVTMLYLLILVMQLSYRQAKASEVETRLLPKPKKN